MACFMAPWWAGANMKPTPTSATQRATCRGVRSRRTPAASRTSALPDLLDTERLPCLATWHPAAAATNMLAVETLKVAEASPPVPTMSTVWGSPASSTPLARERMTWAAAAISATVSPFMRSATRKPATWAGVAAPVMIACMALVISSSVRSWRSMSRAMVSLISKGLALCGPAAPALSRC